METLKAFTHWLGTPFRAIGAALRVVVNLSGRQMRALFSVAMMSGIFSLSLQNIWFTFIAKSAVDKGERFSLFFSLIQEQMRFNSALIAWFAVIMGLIVFGADYFRAKMGNKEVGFGRGATAAEAGEGEE